MNNDPPGVIDLVREDRLARLPAPPADPLIARLDHAVLSIGALAARPRFHTESRQRAGLGGRHFPEHPARRVDPAQYGVLAALDGNGMPGPTSIAIRLGLHPSTVSHHLERLERRGLIERHRFRAHRKWGDMRLTRAGREAYVTIRDARHEALKELLHGLTDDQREQVVRALALFGDAVRRHNLRAHRRDLDRVLARIDGWSPEQRRHARDVARERYTRTKRERLESERQRESRRPVVTIGPFDDWPGWGA